MATWSRGLGAAWVVAAMFSAGGAAAAPAAAAKAEVVAMVTDVSGKVLVKLGSDAPGPADLLMSLPAGAQITVPGNAELTLIYYGSAKEYRFTGPDAITLGADKPVSMTGAEDDARTLAALGGNSISAREVQQLVQAGLQMRSSDLRKRIQLRNPVGTVVTETNPVFSWSALEPDVQYRFALRDDAGLTVLETLVTRIRLRLPDELKLRDGAAYNWSVDARGKNGNEYSATGEFTVATMEQRATLDALRVGLGGGSTSERLLYAILLQKLGMQGEASAALQKLAADKPDSGQLQRISAQAALMNPQTEH